MKIIPRRIAILLARNPSQLEAIANELVRLERACGGIVNYETAELSLRDDLLKVGFNTGYRSYYEEMKRMKPEWNGFAMSLDQTFTIVVGRH